MGHRVAGIVPHVEDQPIAALEPFGVGHLIRQQEHVRQHFRMLGAQRGRILDMSPGND